MNEQSDCIQHRSANHEGIPRWTSL